MADTIKGDRLTGTELDVLILTMTRNARRLVQPELLRSSLSSATRAHVWLENITSQYVLQVFVDEATDFSPVQLGCLIELAHPALRSWFACGDFMQRVTGHGVRSPAEIQWLRGLDGEPIQMERINVGYRQSDKLRGLASALASSHDRASDEIAPPAHEHGNGATPLLVETCDGDALAPWLASRIVEIEAQLGVLPSIAVFVDGDDRIDPLVERLRPLLATRNLTVVGCKEGRVVGDEREVRVFDVRYIKGLEFEAVFFIGVDRLAEHLGVLFDQYFYVGISRAATYLGITCETRLPSGLEIVRHHFSGGGWQ